MSEWIVTNVEFSDAWAEMYEYKRLVRCKDCKFRNTIDCGMQFYGNDDDGNLCLSDDWTDDNGFCYWGERKDDETD